MRRDFRVIVDALVILMLATIPVASAQSPRVGFSAITSTDLAAGNPAGDVVGDFNEDGHLDVMVTLKGAATTNVRLLTGDGTGSFSDARGFSFAEASAIAAADFNGDGALDVAITQDVQSKQNSGYSDFICGSLVGVAIFPGPDMSSARCVATVPRPIAVQPGDFDGDGRPDIAVVSATGLGLKIYRQLDFVNHTLTLTNIANSGVLATSMAPPVDLNADGRLDLVVGHAGGVRVFLGNGDGTFLVGGTVSGTNRVQAVAVGDLNGDGVLDIAAVEATSGGVVVGFAAGDGTFSTQTIATIGTDLTGVLAEDLDHDGRTDVIVAHKGGGTIPILFGNGDGTFVAGPALPLDEAPKSLLARDLDEDGDLDLAIFASGGTAQNARMWMALQDGGGPSDAAPPTVTLTSPVAGGTVSGTVGIAATASDNVGITHVEFYAGATLIAKSAGPNYMVSWNTVTSPNGPVTVTARAFDAAVNESLWSSLEVAVANVPGSDTTPPVVTVPSYATIEATGPSGAVFAFAASAIDDIDGPVEVTCNPASDSMFQVGVTPVTCSASDAQANTASASFTVTVRDTTPPALTLPSNAAVQTMNPVGAVFVYTTSAIDVVDGAVTISCVPASGTAFPVGVTTVNCSAADTTGNPATGSFVVTIVASGLPGAASPVAPSGTVTTATPAFSWLAATASYYLLSIIDGSATSSIQAWYTPAQAGCPGGTGVCTVQAPQALTSGLVRWRVLTWNHYGYGPWSSVMESIVDQADGSTPTPTTLEPSGPIGTRSPGYAWSPVVDAVWYQLSVTDALNTTRQFWYTPQEACASSPCAVAPNVALAAGPAGWEVRAWRATGAGAWSSLLAFETADAAPGKATLVSPTSDVPTSTPTFTWNAVIGTSYYLLRVIDRDNVQTDRWYRPLQAACPLGKGTCSVSLESAVAAGPASWQVLTWNGSGSGPWSDPRAFTVDIADPAVGTPQPLGPIGAVAVTNPTFAWTAVSGAMFYRLSIRYNGDPAVHWWFSPASAECQASAECSAVLQGLPGGTAEWQIQAWSVNGRGGWSAPSVVVVATPAPAAPILVYPAGPTGATPAFVWNASTNVVWYYIQVYDATGLRVDRWVRPGQAGCPGGTGACAIDAGVTLEIGAGWWRVIAWNATGYSPWSNTMTFVRAY